jgi:hypothetical protein
LSNEPAHDDYYIGESNPEVGDCCPTFSAPDQLQGEVVAEKMTALEAYLAGILTLPPGYELEPGPDVLFLRRDDESVGAVFVTGATPSEVARTAEEDYRKYGRSTA